jgi:hypothetical protein
LSKWIEPLQRAVATCIMTSGGVKTGPGPGRRRSARCSLHLAALAAPHSNLLIAPTEPEPGDLRGACWLQSRVETAARTCLWAACHRALSAAERLCLAAHCNLSAWALLQRLHPCSGPVQSGGSQGCPKVLELLRVALGGCGNVVGHVVRFEWSTGFEFLTVFQCHPPRFAAS